MARLVTRVFDPAQPLFARRAFVAAGHHFSPGDAFDWQRLAVDVRRTRQLYESGKLAHDEAAVASPEAPAVIPEAKGEDIPSVAIAPAAAERRPAAEQVTAAAEEPVDDLTDLDMKALRQIALEIDAPYRVSRTAQREAIREHRSSAAR